MSVIGTMVIMGSGFIASAGTGALAKAVFTKVLTSEESQKMIIKIGTYAVTATVGGAVGTYVMETVRPVIRTVDLGVDKLKLKIKNKKESKE